MPAYLCWLLVSTKDGPWWSLSPTGNLQAVEKSVKIRWNSWRHLAQWWWWERPVPCRPLAPATRQGQRWIRGRPTMKAARQFGWELPTPIGGKLSLVLEENERGLCAEWIRVETLTLCWLIHGKWHTEKKLIV